MLIKELKGELITLKELNPEHFEQYYKMFSPTVRKLINLPPIVPLQETIDFLKDQLIKHLSGEILFYNIFDNKEDKLIGSIVIRGKDKPKGELDNWINEKYWGGGRYQEALALMCKIFFQTHPSEDSFNAQVDEANERSYFALKKFGFEDVTSFQDSKLGIIYFLKLKKIKVLKN